MTSDRRFEQDLPSLLDDLHMGPMPGYRDHVLQQTARTHQRPAWSFLERWIPMVDIARQPVVAPPIPWRTIGLGVALVALLVAMVAALVVGSRPNLPAPFGQARNGLVAFTSDGDIYTADPVTGLAAAVVTGPETDLRPVWSRDGTRVAFERKAVAGASDGRLFVARADGSELVAIIPEPLLLEPLTEEQQVASYTFSPDGSEVALTSGPEADSELWLAKADGSGARRIDVGMSVYEASYRPPNGAEIIFVGGSAMDVGTGIYAVDVATGTVRTIVEPSAELGIGWIRVAPDGSRVAYDVSTIDPTRNRYQVHVRDIDGSGTLILTMPQGATFQGATAWSNDGTRLVVVRGYASRNQEMTLAVLPADGSAVGIESDRGLTGCCDTITEWAPDDTSILISPTDLSGQFKPQLLLDPLTGTSRPAPWDATSNPAWQRLAP
jgi:Tol biopolymer transport system component